MEAKALWHISQYESGLRTFQLRSDKGCIYVKSLFSMISVGTERNIAMGNVPEDMYHAMSVPDMQGSFPFPVTHGYSLVGIVRKGPAELSGKIVHMLHPHQDYVALTNDTFFVIPPDVDPVIAALGSNMETVINAIWDAQLLPGDNVLITGFGTVGALLAITLKLALPYVTCRVLEPDIERRQTGSGLGLQMAAHADELNTGFDVTFDVSGNESALQTCIDKAGYEGKIVSLSWFGTKSTSLKLGGDFHSKRKKLISSQVSNIPLHKQGQWDFRRRKELVFNILQHEFWKKIPFAFIPFEETPAFFNELRVNNTKEIFNIIKYT